MSKGAAWVRSSEKQIMNAGRWASGKKMPRDSFPLRPSQAYRLPGTWTWRVISFSVRGDEYRVLLAYKADKQEFRAMLGRLTDREMTVLCRVEHHGSHPGWHVHYQPQKIKQSGVVIGIDIKKRACGLNSRFGTDVVSGFDDWAISVGYKLFKLPHAGGGANGTRLL